MGKVLHASYSGHFPWCESETSIEPYALEGDSIAQIMIPFWRILEWQFTISYDFGDGLVVETETFVPEKFSSPFQTISKEEDFVCAYAGVGRDGLAGSSGQIHYIKFGGNHYQNFLGFDYFREGNDEQAPVSIDPNYSPSSVSVGTIGISGNGFAFIKSLYSTSSSYSVNVTLVANQYWPYGGTYDIATGNRL